MNNAAMAEAVQKKAKKKFYGNQRLKAKVKPNFPDNLVREYMRITNAYMVILNKVVAEKLPAIRRAIDDDRKESMRMDARQDVMKVIADTMRDIQMEYQRRADLYGLQEKIDKLSGMERRRAIKEWKRIVRQTLGIDILEDYYKGEFFDHALKMWTQQNVDLIKTIQQNTLSNIRNKIEEGYRSGWTHVEIAKEIQDAWNDDKRYAQFVARDQIAKLNSDITQAQQRDAGVSEYLWQTSGDQRVRERHAELDGKRFSWDDPPVVDLRTGRRGHPGEDYQCRCVSIPIFDIENLVLPYMPDKEDLPA